MSTNVVITFSPELQQATPAEAVRFHYPPPQDGVVKENELTTPDTMLVSFIASPVNPQDLLVISGRYPVKPLHKHEGEPIVGYDGVARIQALKHAKEGNEQDGCSGPSPTSPSGTPLAAGDLVIPRRHGLGTWRTHAVLGKDDVFRLHRSTTDPAAASLLRMAFMPAYLLVHDMRALQPGDWIVQNAGSGTIARLVAQFARLLGCHTCSVVRDRDEVQQLEELLHREGCDVVVTESLLAVKGCDAHPLLADAVTQCRVVLALDSVFGESGERLASLLSKGATFVNYGSLGGADGVVRLSQKMIFWNEIVFRNFRLSEQLSRRTAAQQELLIHHFEDLLEKKDLVVPDVSRIRVPKVGDDCAGFEKAFVSALSNGVVGARKTILEWAH